MKKLIITTLALFATLNVQARSQLPEEIIASLQETQNMYIDGEFHETLSSIKVSNYGAVEINVKFRNIEQPNLTLHTLVSPSTNRLIHNLYSQLQIAKITTLENQIICMMMPPFAGKEAVGLSVLQNGEFKEILNPRGCWVGRRVFPSDRDAHNAATALKAALEVILNEEVNKALLN